MCHYSILACPLGLQSSNSQHSPLSRANQAAAAAAAANVALAARRGSYPLSAVAALTAAQQRNLAALSGAAAGGVAVSTVAATLPSNVSVVTGVGSMRGGAGPTLATVQSGNPSMVSVASGQPQHASLTAVAAAQQLHGLTP